MVIPVIPTSNLESKGIAFFHDLWVDLVDLIQLWMK